MYRHRTQIKDTYAPPATSRDKSAGEDSKPDWRFALLAEFEDLLRAYGQNHVSIQ